MMDSRGEKCNNGSGNEATKSKDNSQEALSKTDTEVMKVPRDQLLAHVKPNPAVMFQPTSTQQPQIMFSIGQSKPQTDLVVAVTGGIDLVTVSGGFVKNSVKPPNANEGQSGFKCVGMWSDSHLGARPQQQQQTNRIAQPPPSGFVQGHRQNQTDAPSQLLPLSFLSKASSARETNGNGSVSVQSGSSKNAGDMEKLCPTVGEKAGALEIGAQQTLGFTDTGQSGPSTAPDIHTVTLQLSKSQVEDVLPPVFSVTPKGSGAGYGVGFDLDDLLNQSLTDLQHCDRECFDSAPLSASLLSDWSEVHRMTPADLESLQQELQLGSPMILSDTIPPDA